MTRKRNALPSLDYLIAFEAAARLGGFARAAEHLHIAESAVSRKVRLLEAHFGCALFTRGHRSVTLTREGARYFEAIAPPLDALQAAADTILPGGAEDTVDLAATHSVASLWLLPRLPRFHRENAALRIKLTASDSDAECLSDERALTILRGEGTWPGYDAELLFGETVFPVCAPAYRDQWPETLSVATTQQLDLIEVSSTHPEWMDWRQWLEGRGMGRPVEDRQTLFNTYPLAIEAAVSGLGIALGWGHLVDRHLERGQLIRPFGDAALQTTSGYYLLRRQGRTAPAAQTRVARWLLRESAARRRYGAGGEPSAPP
ncbi:LysR substrate-binding domain-containing protein [Roseobacter weihaiensis]|uniref:LysR substrate-binding domain-containing protein n=1 Tax=Roseobacter weihaiensis TaxID=2763262 RepID=UPI001D0A09C4|nr:LysR substrate-binding domain-containing protein [Roseobacter sp. H9]